MTLNTGDNCFHIYAALAGSSVSPLSLGDRLPAGLWIPPVTVVFCKVDGAGHSMISRQEAEEVHVEVVALMCSVLRQVRGVGCMAVGMASVTIDLVFQQETLNHSLSVRSFPAATWFGSRTVTSSTLWLSAALR